MDKELHRIASTCIIHRDGKYLLLQRSFEKKAFPGKWTNFKDKIKKLTYSTDDR